MTYYEQYLNTLKSPYDADSDEYRDFVDNLMGRLGQVTVPDEIVKQVRHD